MDNINWLALAISIGLFSIIVLVCLIFVWLDMWWVMVGILIIGSIMFIKEIYDFIDMLLEYQEIKGKMY